MITTRHRRNSENGTNRDDLVEGWGQLCQLVFAGFPLVVILFLVGCASSQSHPTGEAKSVKSFSLAEGRYQVYYRSSKIPTRAKATLLDATRLVSTSLDGNKTDSGGAGDGVDTPSDKEASDGEKSASSSGEPRFGAFEEEYESARSEPRQDVYDPLEGYNRFMFQVNDRIYVYVLKPGAKGWRFIMPEPARFALDRAFENVFFPIRFVNSTLQLELEGAGREAGRFLVNTTVGIGGLFDPARHWIGWKANEEDFGQTLGRWGVGSGFPVVLPLLGMSNLRDTAGMIPDSYLNPLTYIDPYGLQAGVRALYRLNVVSIRVIGVYDRQKEQAIDPYTLFRNLYRQNRTAEIKK